jgi:hypothetical protein
MFLCESLLFARRDEHKKLKVALQAGKPESHKGIYGGEFKFPI